MLFDNGFTDGAILGYLAACERRFDEGEKVALFEAIVICARFQAVQPEFAADAILAAQEGLDRGGVADFNAVFGEPPANARDRRRETLIAENAGRVRAMLANHRREGGTFNAEEAFDPIAEELNIPRRIVEAIYKSHPELKDIPRDDPTHTMYESASFKVKVPRRRGRRIL
ncbi:MAG: hypothetical protein P8106_01045 [Gammaproteobacteria bacterium]